MTTRPKTSACNRSVLFTLLVLLGTVPMANAQLTAAGADAIFMGDLPGESNEHNAVFGEALAVGDFNGDGFEDVAVGAMGAGSQAAGEVHVLYGSASGLDAASSLFLDQESFGLGFLNSAGDRFGAALGAGDFDLDGNDDLAIGVPGKDRLSGEVDDGFVLVIHGDSSGLDVVQHRIWSQEDVGMEDGESDDRFGESLATGDFNGDGISDLAVGAPGESETTSEEGAVSVIYGVLNSGLSSAGAMQLNYSDTPFGAPTVELGSSLVAGDFDGLYGDDLAMGSKGASPVVFVFYSSGIVGLSLMGIDRFVTTLIGTDFGADLASGDLDGDGLDELIVGHPGFAAGSASGGGASIYLGQPTGLDNLEAEIWTQDASLQAQSEIGDGYGSAVVAGDFDGDGNDDFAMGGPLEDLPEGGSAATQDEGAVLVFRSSPQGLAVFNTRFWTQSLALAPAEDFDRFGEELATGDFNGDGADDLVVGTPFEDTSIRVDTGAVYVFYGQVPIFADGFESGDTQSWN